MSTQGKAFNQKIVETMVKMNQSTHYFCAHPILLNKAECTAEEAYTWTKGKTTDAGGVQFPNVKIAEKAILSWASQ